MLFLTADILAHLFHLRLAHGKRSVTALPGETPPRHFIRPSGRVGLELLNEFRDRGGRLNLGKEMNMVGSASDLQGNAAQSAHRPTEIFVQFGAQLIADERITLFSGKNNVV